MALKITLFEYLILWNAKKVGVRVLDYSYNCIMVVTHPAIIYAMCNASAN